MLGGLFLIWRLGNGAALQPWSMATADLTTAAGISTIWTDTDGSLLPQKTMVFCTLSVERQTSTVAACTTIGTCVYIWTHYYKRVRIVSFDKDPQNSCHEFIR